MKRALRRKVAESTAIAQPGEETETITPPSAAPSTFVEFSASRRVAFACWISSGGTVCGTIPADAGKKNAVETPLRPPNRSSCQSSALPVRRRTATAPCVAPLAMLETTITLFRGSRSAHTPPIRRNTTWGTARAARTRPRSDFDPVRSMTANASAIGAIAFPRKEIARPAKSRRNSRSASGA